MKPIDADALKSKMDGYWGRCQRIRKPRNGETAVFLDIKAIVEAQPTVDAVPVRHGKWMRTEDECGDFLCWTCSECGEQYVMPHHRASYCPNCGAKMDERKEHDICRLQ